jgi:acetolactate synthase I/III small subunit
MMATAPRRQTLPAGEPDAEHRRHVVSALVIDRPGTLNRVSGLLRARSFNIESLTVGTTHEPGKSRMTIAIRGDDGHLRQVLAQLERVIDVLEVHDLTTVPHVELELALVEIEPPAGADAESRLRAALDAAGGELITPADGSWRARRTRPRGRAARDRCGLGGGRCERGDDARAGHGGAIGLSRRGSAQPA